MKMLNYKSNLLLIILPLPYFTCFFIIETLIISDSITKHLGKEFSDVKLYCSL